MGDEVIRLVYFDIRGLVEPVRWMLKIAGQDFQDERIPLEAWAGTGIRKRSSDGRSDKKRKSVDTSVTIARFKAYIGQLPILYIGDDFVLTQTLTVTRHLARKFGFNGRTAFEEARADEIADLVYDLRLRAMDYEGKGRAFQSGTPDIVRHTVFRDFNNAPDNPKKDKMKDDFRQMYFPLYFSKFAKMLEEAGGVYVAGPNLTYGDLALVNLLEVVQELIDPECLAEFPTLRALQERIFSIPAIMEWKQEQKDSATESGYLDPEAGAD